MVGQAAVVLVPLVLLALGAVAGVALTNGQTASDTPGATPNGSPVQQSLRSMSEDERRVANYVRDNTSSPAPFDDVRCARAKEIAGIPAPGPTPFYLCALVAGHQESTAQVWVENHGAIYPDGSFDDRELRMPPPEASPGPDGDDCTAAARRVRVSRLRATAVPCDWAAVVYGAFLRTAKAPPGWRCTNSGVASGFTVRCDGPGEALIEAGSADYGEK
jgi:hypothetical protein